VNAKGTSAPTLLAIDPDLNDYLIASPRFSPDGTQILFTLNDALWIMNSNGDNQHRLFAAPSVNGVFSPDGTLIYFSGTLPNGQSGVIRANADGSNPVVIVIGTSYQVADGSPNGQSLLLTGVGNYTVNTDGTGLQPIDGLSPGSWY
jgi:Tol biopolymer transport system component